jgi:hypothetical protein
VKTKSLHLEGEVEEGEAEGFMEGAQIVEKHNLTTKTKYKSCKIF